MKNSIWSGTLREYSPNSDDTPQQTWSVNVHLLCEILDNRSASRASHHSDDIFGQKLAKDSISYSGNTDSQAFDPDLVLIGTPGISGHRTVANEAVTYPPDKLPSQLLQPNYPIISQQFSSIAPADVARTTGNLETRNMDGSDGPFLQLNDHGMAIEQWLNFNVT